MAHLDLHLHTTYSDGTLSPRAVVAEAAAHGVTLIAITDHDEVAGIAPAQAAGAELGVRVLSGVEINTEVGRQDVHILGYGFPAESPELRAGLQRLRDSRLERLHLMLKRMADIGYPVEAARVLAIAGHGSVGRPHLARAIAEAGYTASYAEAFDKFIGHDRPAYVPRRAFTPEEAVALIHQAGGLASLAHPGKLGDPVGMVNRLLRVGLDALEVYHSDHLPEMTRRMARLAAQCNLLVTGGSDSHGPGGPRTVPIGAIAIPDDVGERLLARLGT